MKQMAKHKPQKMADVKIRCANCGVDLLWNSYGEGVIIDLTALLAKHECGD
jgi:hypothetical protein